jgi:hypothetical protein
MAIMCWFRSTIPAILRTCLGEPWLAGENILDVKFAEMVAGYNYYQAGRSVLGIRLGQDFVFLGE